MTVALRQKPLARVVMGIVKSANGAWFDPSDLSTLYQDAAGTTPVTAVEQPVGKILDKSGNGYHATQSITASRPTLSARYNLLTKTEDFSQASAWQGNGVNITSNVYKTPFSLELLADKITISTSSGAAHFVYHQPLQYIAGLTYTYTHNIAYAGYRYVQLTFTSAAFGTEQYANFDLQSGIVTSQSGGTASIVSTGNGFFQISFTAIATTTATGGSAISYIDSPTSGRLPPLTGDGVSGYYVFGASLVIGTTSGPYQRVNTATDYDTDPRYFPKYLRFDGVDDYLTLGDVFDIGSEGVSIATSVILFDATKSPIAGKSRATAKGGRYFLGVEPDSFLFASHDSAPPVNIAYSQSIGESVVLSAKLWPHGNRRLSLYKNANLLSTVNTSLTTASYDTTDPFWIGAYPNSTGTTPAYGYLKGGIYGLIITKSALTDAQRVRCERFLARKAGVML